MAKKKKTENVRSTALTILERVDKGGAYSHLLLHQVLEKKVVPAKDEGLLTEIVYGTIKRKKTLDFYLSPFVKQGLHKLDHWVLNLLRMTVYQIAYLEKVPDRASVHEAVELAKNRGHKGISGFVNGVLRSVLRQGLPSTETISQPLKKMAVETSHPEWLLESWISYYGEVETRKMAERNLLPPPVNVRVNRLKATIEEFLHEVSKEGCQGERGKLAADAVRMVQGKVTLTRAYQKGWATFQDESSMLVARALEPQEEMRTLDACAAPGGKSTHLAERMNDTGSVDANELHKKKTVLIEELANRLDLTSIRTHAHDARKLSEVFEVQSFDRVLVDAPCSGLGVIRRKPEIKWEKTEDSIAQLPLIQLAILKEAAKMTASGGRLVYSTCTVHPQENEKVVESFLKEHPDYDYDETLYDRLPKEVSQLSRAKRGHVTILPHDFDSDGFFICSLKRK